VNRSGIVLAGTVILDIVHMVDHWPDQESVAFIERTEYGAGGPPQNAAAGLKRMKAPFPVTLQGVVGDDAYADIFIGESKAQGLASTHLVRKPNSFTSNTQVMTTVSDGSRTFFHKPGVNASLTPDLLLPRDRNAKIFYLGSPGIARTMDEGGHWVAVMREAKRRGYLTALELVPVERKILAALVPPILPEVDICVINDHEAQAVTGDPVTDGPHLDWRAAEEACGRLLDMGVVQVAAVHHPDGAVALTRSGEWAHAPSVDVPRAEIVGTVGAGDAFYAGFLLAVHEGWPLSDCLALANAAAATSLHSATTSSSIRSWQDCLSYAEVTGLKPMGHGNERSRNQLERR
jgi:sugar/nucleoside kinase (ribokinase family)